ncbi:MAG: DUF2254 domain-containing protein [Saprospiraceae bacterium]
MIKLKNYLLSFYRNITRSIAFFPSLIAFGMICFSLIVLVAEQYGATSFLQETIDFLVTYDIDTARTIMSVLIGSIISLTVFSFSMVMILLSQASSLLSPRLLPGLISNKSHQIVLGVYLGTTLYCLLILININNPDNESTLPGFAILLAIILGLICMALFVYFIHSISTAIQASNVLNKIFNDTKRDLQELFDESNDEPDPGQINPDSQKLKHEVMARQTGYLQEISTQSLLDIAIENDLTIKMEVTRGMFVIENVPIALCSKKLDEEVLEDLQSCFTFSNRELVRENYVLGFKQITEIAVKAMSPGINDPGTALIAIDYLTELFAERMKVSDQEIIKDEEGNVRIYFNTVSFKDLFYNVFASLRIYTKHDVVIVQKLIMMLRFLQYQKANANYSEVLKTELETLLEDANESISNSRDKKIIQQLAG